MRLLRTIGPVVALACTLIGGAASAEQQTIPPTSDDSESSAESEDRHDDIESILVMGVRGGTLADEPSAFATRVDLDQFAGEQKRLEDLLSRTPGVQIRRFGGAGERSEISIRGFAPSQVVVALDGVPLNSVFGGGVDLSAIPIELLEQVEVSRGGGSVAAGSGAMGGVVALRTKRPGSAPTSQVKAQVSSFDTYSASAFHSAPGRLADYAIGYSYFRTDGDYKYQRPVRVLPGGTKIVPDPRSVERINNEHERHTLTANLGRNLARGSYLSMSQILGYRSQGQPGPDRQVSSSTGGQQEHAHLRELSSLSQLRWEEIDIGVESLTSEASLSYRHQHNKFKDEAPAQVSGPIDTEDDDSTAAIRFESTWQGVALGFDHTLSAELGGQREALDASDISLEERYGTHLRLREEARIFAEKLICIPAVRADWSDDSDFRLLPSLGVVVTPYPWLRIKANAERSFRNPSFGALYLPDRGFVSGNRDLDPEKSNNFDIGLELVFENLGPFRDVKLSGSVFYNELENTIIWVFVSPTRISPRNSGDATTKGYEVSGALRFGRFFSVSSNHTYLDASYDSGPRLPGRAESETNVRLQISEPDLFKIVGELQHTGSISVSEGGSYIIPSRDVWNASAGLNLEAAARLVGWEPPLDHVWLSFSVDNIGDRSIQDSLYFPQPGRSYGVSLEAKW